MSKVGDVIDNIQFNHVCFSTNEICDIPSPVIYSVQLSLHAKIAKKRQPLNKSKTKSAHPSFQSKEEISLGGNHTVVFPYIPN